MKKFLRLAGWVAWCACCVCGAGLAQASVAAGRVLSGVVTDVDGALIPGARVTLQGVGAVRTAVTGSDGHFSFGDVSGDGFVLSVTAEGMAEVSEKGALGGDESLELPPIVLRVSASSDVEVTSLTREEIAEKQLKVEETQRLGGLVPNFYVTYDWKAEALTPKQKFQLAARSLADPATFVIVGGFAGIEQAENSFSGYGPGAAGYGKRYGAGLADASVGTMLGGAILPILFRQDPRYFYKGTGSVRSRVLYALSTAVVARGDNGKWQPAYAGVLGDFGSGAISNLYYPASDRHGANLTLENGALSVGFDAFGNLMQEFILPKLTSRRANGASNP